VADGTLAPLAVGTRSERSERPGGGSVGRSPVLGGSSTGSSWAPGRDPDDGRGPGQDEPRPDPVPTWDEVAHRYGKKIYTIAYRLTGDPEEAKDLTQDVFVRVYRNLDKYEPGTFDGWVYRITKNLFLDRVRRKKRVLLEPLPDEEWRQPEDEGPGPDAQVDIGMLRGDIERALTTLPPDFRTAVVLCDVQGLSYEEIAEATGWPLGTVRSRIHRGRKLLRGEIEAMAARGESDV
jgi:RNA polymerase sigma-70 factor, ECF subfamily